jgi:hypothetical protein
LGWVPRSNLLEALALLALLDLVVVVLANHIMTFFVSSNKRGHSKVLLT